MPEPTLIEARSSWRLLDWPELSRFRDLFFHLVLRDIKVLYKQTVLGFGWAIIRPLFSVVVFSIVFGGLAGVPSDGVPYPLFTLTAVLPWTYFATAVGESTGSLVKNAPLLTKVYFPRLLIPLTPVFAGLVDFAIGLALLACLMLWYGVVPGVEALLLPLFILLAMMNAAGLGLWLSALAIRYRDVKHATMFFVQILMYAAPVVWPISLLDERFPEHAETIRWIYGLYPMAGVIEASRSSLLGSAPLPTDLLISGTIGALTLVVTGLVFFNRAERRFADVI